MRFESRRDFMLVQCVTVCCNVLQCVAMCCSVLQCVTVGALEQRSGKGMRFESTPVPIPKN